MNHSDAQSGHIETVLDHIPWIDELFLLFSPVKNEIYFIDLDYDCRPINALLQLEMRNP